MAKGSEGALGGTFWFIGFLFTVGYTSPVWWKVILDIVIWPFFLGQALK